MRSLQLLSPARDAETARVAILHGADAIYIGGPHHGARAAAFNSISDIARVVDMAHCYGVKVYVTLNTIIFEHELKEVESSIWQLYRVGVDALIVQDLGILRLDIPPIDLHASTQCDISSIEKACFLADCGFSQLVLPRELSIKETEKYHQALGDKVALEAFVHGALCVSYSGNCQASYSACGRSANRGECAQMCRLPYSLVDAQGNVLIRDKHLLSLRDLNRIATLQQMAHAGVSSFKIEGRLKDATYVKTVTAAYRTAIDQLIADYPHLYTRDSWGQSDIKFTPDLNKAFNRGFTSYFTNNERPTTKMANIDTPKWVGEKVGSVISTKGNKITAKLSKPINNGDGLGFFNSKGSYDGFRVNRAEGNTIYTLVPIAIAPGTDLYRNNDALNASLMAAETATRLIDVDLTLSASPAKSSMETITLTISDHHQHMAQNSICIERQQARTPQTKAREKALSKLGDTIYRMATFTDNVADDLFIPLSTLSALRRDTCDTFANTIKATYKYKYRLAENSAAQYNHTLDYHDNVANSAAEEFYKSHGANIKERAIETRKPETIAPGSIVMTTRYCLRRELSACLRTQQAAKLPSPLYLKNATTTYKLDFDCANCRMHLRTTQ